MALIAPPTHALARAKEPIDVGRLVAEPIIMSELTVGYGQVVTALFSDLGIRPNIVAVADNIETMKVMVQSGGGIAIVPRACAENETALGVLATLAIRAATRRRAQPVPPPSAAVAAQGRLPRLRTRRAQGLS